MSQRSSLRPQELYPIFSSCASLKGVGDAIAKALSRSFKADEGGEARVKELLWHLPRSVLQRKCLTYISDAAADEVVTIALTIDLHAAPPLRSRRPYVVHARDDAGEPVRLLWFKGDKSYLRRLAPEGERRLVSGRVEQNRGIHTIAHPDYIVAEEEAATIPVLEPIYALPAGVNNKLLRKLVEHALSQCPDLAEWISPSLLAERKWLSWRDSLAGVHNIADGVESLSPLGRLRERLAYDELLAHHLALLILRRFMRRKSGMSLLGDGRLTEALLQKFPFSLTASQRSAFAEISRDMGSDLMMLRLLQGDVGSGKTVVALLAMAVAVESGGQAALLVPTEILAQQHFATVGSYLEGMGVGVDLLTGRHKGKSRSAILARLASGETSILIGTHALFQNDVVYRDLRLAVIDEQHRFGVEQRLAILSKGERVDLLAMTATPIPRTLARLAYGDLDSSRLTEKPSGFRSVSTSLISLPRLDEVLSQLARPLAAGGRIYWVCPLVEESENLDLAAAEARYRDLRGRFGDRVGLLHGRMKSREKEAVMNSFKEGEITILISTTVIEVGVDVAEANIMIVEHAERFGLAQLHQLRGRVGRGGEESHCILLYDNRASAVARERLGILRSHSDGFMIAEEDFRLRRGGEVLGVRQSGFPRFGFVDLAYHGDLSEVALSQARLLVGDNFSVRHEANHNYLVLLHLFEASTAMGYLRAG